MGPGGIDITRVSGVSISDVGGILASGGTAIGFDGSGNMLTLGAGYTISGMVSATGVNTLQLGGSGPAAFDLADVGSTYLGFNNREVIGGFWTVTSGGSGWTIESGGTMEVATGAELSGSTVRSGGVLIVKSGGAISGVTVSSGGIVAVLSDGIGTPTMLAGAVIGVGSGVVSGGAVTSGHPVAVLSGGTFSGGTVNSTAN